MTTGELALAYGISAKTFRRWLEPHAVEVGERPGRYWTPLQVGRIIDLLGPF